MSQLRAFEFKQGWEHKEYGRCQFANASFCTFMTRYPPAAEYSLKMWEHGWEIYVQPWIFRSIDFNVGRDSYVTTWKKRAYVWEDV